MENHLNDASAPVSTFSTRSCSSASSGSLKQSHKKSFDASKYSEKFRKALICRPINSISGLINNEKKCLFPNIKPCLRFRDETDDLEVSGKHESVMNTQYV